MKKQLMALSVLALSVMGGLNMAHAQDGTVTFNGSIVSDSCTIATDSKDITVDFGQMSTVGSSNTDTKDFTINLTACPAAATKATVLLNAEEADGSSNYIADYIDGVKSAGAGADTSHWIIINDVTHGFLPVNGTTDADNDFTIAAGDNKLPLQAALGGHTGPTRKIGSHTGEATYTISYQ